jgi:hypothetical protein
MDAKEFVEQVALKNYEASKTDPTDFRKLWNAFGAMNSVAEFVAIDRLDYGSASQNEIESKYQAVRKQYPALQSIKEGAEMFKDVRRHIKGEVTASSTAISPSDPTTWVLKSRSLRDILDQAAAVPPSIPELK